MFGVVHCAVLYCTSRVLARSPACTEFTVFIVMHILHIITSLVHKDTIMYVLCSTVMDLSLCIAFCIVLCCTSDYSTVLYCTILYFTVLYCTVLYYTVLYSTVLYLHSITSIVLLLYCPGLARTSVSPDPALICHSLTLWHNNLLYFISLYYTVLYCTVLYCTVLYCAIPDCVVLYCTVQ